MLTLATAPGFSRPATSSFCAPGAGWTSEFADEFDGSALDDKVWTVKEGGGNEGRSREFGRNGSHRG